MPCPTLLLIDTSSTTAQAAIWSQSFLAQARSAAGRRNAQCILRLVQECIDMSGVAVAECAAIAIAAGPGSFTGLRIGVGVAQGLAFAHELSTLGVSTLRLDAQMALQRQRSAAVNDPASSHILVTHKALEGEVYWASYRTTGDGQLVQEADERTVAIASANKSLLPAGFDVGACVLVGSGWEPQLLEALGMETHTAMERLTVAGADDERLQALASLALQDLDAGRAQAAACLEPNYVKNEMGYRRAGE